MKNASTDVQDRNCPIVLVLATMLLVSCFSVPDVSSINCKDSNSCPSGYTCVNPGVPGGCKKLGSGLDSGGLEVASHLDSAPSDGAATEAGPGTDGTPSTDGTLGLDISEDRNVADLAQESFIGADLSPATSAETAGGQDGGSSTPIDSAVDIPLLPDSALDVPLVSDGAHGSGGVPGSGGVTISSDAGSAGAPGTGGATSTGGVTGTGGLTGTGGIVGTGGTITNPPGYWMTKDWGVTAVDWHGCVWTGIDTVASSSTNLSPHDFTAAATEGGPYRVSGTIFTDYNAFAELGFNLNEAVTGDSTQCNYNPLDPSAAGPPGINFPSSATGLAINWSAGASSQFRVTIQSADAATNPAHRWCATITDVGGPTFIPFTSFNTKCWSPASGTAYDGTTAIDAVVFQVPGTTQLQSFDFTIKGFAPGTSVSDAPGSYVCGGPSGSLGGAGTTDLDYARVKVKGTDCNSYVIQNNNKGNPTGSDQTLSYSGNSFKVVSSTASGTGSPGSSPSIYQGANGQIQGGALSTTGTDNLPILVSAIQSIQTSFAWSGGTGAKDFNAGYDVWFATPKPTPGGYNDAISGFVQVWLYKPAGHQPTGSIQRTTTIVGHSWDVWVGPYGGTGANSAAPVVSYVAKDSPVASLSFDLNLFIKDSAANGISSSWYVTDIFAGFQIWTGSDATNLQCTSFTNKVQ